MTAYKVLRVSLQSCWNCGRKANETCSGCNSARYCGSFCQHKDWERHHRVCGRPVTSHLSLAAAIPGNPQHAKSSHPLKSVKNDPVASDDVKGVSGTQAEVRNNSLSISSLCSNVSDKH